MNITISKQSALKDNRILLETLLVTIISLSGILLLLQFKLICSLLPIAYLLIERRIRRLTLIQGRLTPFIGVPTAIVGGSPPQRYSLTRISHFHDIGDLPCN